MNRTALRASIAVVVLLAAGVAFYLLRPLFVDQVVNEDFPMAADAVVPDDMTIEEVEAEMVAAAAMPGVEEVEPMPEAAGQDGPESLVSGTFAGVDNFHMGSGTATIYDVDGAAVLRLEDFSVTNGPDLHVYLAPVVDGVPQVNEDSVDLGSLKGNMGNQNYDIPADVDLSRELGVVIWCQPFRVTFATALLA